MDSSHRHNTTNESMNEHMADAYLDPSMIHSMPIEDVKKALNQRDLDPQPTLDWVRHKQKPRVFFLGSPAIRIAATVLLLVITSVLFARQYALDAPPPQIALDPPLGSLYLTVSSEPIFKPANFISTEVPREEYIVDEISGPVPNIFAKAQPYGQVLNNGSTYPSLEVIAFGDPEDPASSNLYDDLKSLAAVSSNARFLFVPVSPQSNAYEVQRVLTLLGVDSVPAVFVNGNPIVL